MFNKTNDAKDSLDAEKNGVADNSSKEKDSNFVEIERAKY